MKKIPFFLVFFAFLSSYGQQEEPLVVMDVEEYVQQLKTDSVQLVDVRTPEEFRAGHIKGAINIDFYASDFLEQFRALDHKKPVYIYCRSGNRSGKAAQKIAPLGFPRIIDLKGGFKQWKQQDQPVQ